MVRRPPLPAWVRDYPRGWLRGDVLAGVTITAYALARMKQDLREALAPTGLLERIGEDHGFPTLPTAVDADHEWRAGHG